MKNKTKEVSVESFNMPSGKLEKHTPTIEETAARNNLIMENIAVYDTLTREGFSDDVINRIVRAVNNHKKLVQTLRATAVGYHEASSHEGPFQKCGWTQCEFAKEAIEQAEGGK